MSFPPRPLAALLLTGVAVLAGCQSPSPAAPSAPTTAVPTSTAAAPTTAAGGDSSATATPGGGGGSDDTRCTLDEVSASLGRTTGEAGQRHTAIVWTNTSAQPCTMTGFGGVDLQGPDDPMGPTYSLRRAEQPASPVRLEPGSAAHTTITWLPPQDGSEWTPSGMLVTPPDETRSASLEWPGGAVLRQDGATRPGTYISPVRPGVEG
ncbi:DUF4232 domain-containing protein [Pseudonocardia sp. MH-G8]|uniref:DUF4232 domain-containing protein n=1 Tax=Pseudonocardia sp. MH-G8 TaxID=1854588 RepID=UPI000BA182DE|nr:DUF4232 domain-containing protein [Pseudonocardia sp. MH-G8]OZM75865.1 hypothetical protein CFP66_44280 [Pseudonocardia sp. MH-G8]